MYYSPFHSIVFNLALTRYHSNTKNSRRVKKMYNRLLDGRLGNTSVIARLQKKNFFCPFSHKMLFYQKDFPLYDRQLSRLCNWLASYLNREIGIIDVGANIGDTVRNIGLSNAFYLCIEGDKSFSKYIKSNLKGYKYALENVFLCDNESQGGKYSIHSSNGTGHLAKDENEGNIVNTITLDDLLTKKYNKRKFDLLKIDTDGFDFKVIRGGYDYLKEELPLLYFEWDKNYCQEQSEDPLSIFPLLDKIGYTKCILFDNYGNYFDCVATSGTQLLHSYLENTQEEGLPYYYDVLAIPENKGYNAVEMISLFR